MKVATICCYIHHTYTNNNVGLSDFDVFQCSYVTYVGVSVCVCVYGRCLYIYICVCKCVCSAYTRVCCCCICEDRLPSCYSALCTTWARIAGGQMETKTHLTVIKSALFKNLSKARAQATTTTGKPQTREVTKNNQINLVLFCRLC